MPVKKEREYRTLVAPLAAQSSGEKRLQSECYVEGYATTFNAPYLLYEFEDGTKIYERIDAHALDSADMSDVIMQYDHEGRTQTMRLKEIEARLAEIKEELNTRAAELTDEEITKLETEVTDLQEERTALLAAAEKRKKLLERIAAGEPTGGAGADTTLLRNFKGAGGAGAGEPEDKYDTTAYRKAFMNYVCRGVAIPAEYRAAETTTTADSGAVIPTTIMNEIIQKLESYGSIYAKVRKINVQGGVSIPIADLKPTAHWITEAKSSDDQKASAKNSVTFNYYGLECKISQSILANVVTLKMFTDLFVPMATEAMVKAIEIAIFNGTGEGQPLGVLKDSRVTAVITLTPEEYASWNGWHKVKGKMKKAYRNGSFVMNQSTFDTGIDGMEDKNGQPIGRTNYGVNGEETYRFMGKNVETVEDDVLPSWDDANEGDVIAVFMNFSDYVINTNMEMQVVKWTDHDNNKIKNKCLMVVDGKVADAAGIILVKKGVTAV